ncbi:MAG TPA: hypothetical protein DDW23_06570, partial [Planctomycetes bacterium]|nr:hypothetical protein [Planctomycetota bacterium]
MTAIRTVFGPLVVIALTVTAAWLLVWGFSFGGRFLALFFAICAGAIGWSRIRDLERFAFLGLGACFSIGVSFHLTEWAGSLRAKFGGGFYVTLTETWILILLGCWLMRSIRAGLGINLQTRVLWPAYLMIPFALQAGIRTIEDPVTGIWMFWRFLLALGMALYLANNVRPKEDYRILAWTISGVVLFQALVGFGQEITGGALGLGLLGGERNLTTIKGTIEISRMVGTV